VIVSFGDRRTQDLYHGTASARSRSIPPDLRTRAYRKLALINDAHALDDLAVVPGNRLEALAGELAGRHSIRINDQWRLVFRWKDGNAHEVTIQDYH